MFIYTVRLVYYIGTQFDVSQTKFTSVHQPGQHERIGTPSKPSPPNNTMRSAQLTLLGFAAQGDS